MSEVRQALDKDLKELNKSLQRYEEQLAGGNLDPETRKFVMESIAYYRGEVKAVRSELIGYARTIKDIK